MKKDTRQPSTIAMEEWARNRNPAAVALGSIRSKKKALSSARNGRRLAQRTHIRKTRHFLKTYPHPLNNNELGYKFPLKTLTKTGRISTYNPDFYCPATNYYIEVATSKPNISEQRLRWAEAIALGLKLKVFWWEGEEITERFTV